MSEAPRPEPAAPTRASLAQEWAYLASLADPKAPALQFNAAYRLRGPLDVTCLTIAINAVVGRHPALRSRFEAVEGAVFQHVVANAPLSAELQEVPPDAPDRVEAGRRVLAAEAWRPFDRSSPPLVRLLVVRLGDEDHLAVLVLDHLVADGVSLDVITRDLGEAYAACIEGRPSRLGRRPRLYSEWAERQRARLAGERGEEIRSYWLATLGPDPSVLGTPLPGYRGAAELTGASMLVEQVPGSVAAGLGSVSARLRATPLAAAATGLKILLAHETGRRRITIQTSVANRDDPGFDDCVGWFANGVYPTTDIDLSLPFGRLVEAVQQSLVEAIAHGDAPGFVLRRSIWPDDSGGFRKTPIVYFMYPAELWGSSLDLAGLAVESVRLEEPADSPGLHLWMIETPSGLELECFSYASEYPEPVVAAFASKLIAVLDAAVGAPGAPAAELVTAAESRAAALV